MQLSWTRHRKFTRTDAYGATLRWEDENTLSVEYLSSRFAQVERPIVVVGRTSVSVLLRSGVDDKTTQVGGMLDDLGYQKPN